MSKLFAPLALALCAATSAQAQVALIAKGSVSGAYQDLSSATATPLENGVAGNRLGGLGSGLAYAGGSTFIAVPDRGPNAVSYNAALDDTSSYIDRIQTFDLRFAPAAADSGTALPFVLTPTLRATTLLSSGTPLVYGSGAGLGVGSGAPTLNGEDTFYFTGRSDNFDPATLSTDPRDARFDPESIRVSRDGRHVFISDEYGPHIYEFDRRTGRRTRIIQLPDLLAVRNQSPVGDAEISGNASGRVANKGMEGLAISPDGRTLFGAMQSPLIQDGGTGGSVTRFLAIDLRTGAVRQFAYPLTNIGTAKKPKYPTVSDIVAVNDHQLLVDERDGKGLGDGSVAAFKQISLVDLKGAQDVSALSGEASLIPLAVQKTLFLDVVAALGASGLAPQDIPAKLEGLAFGPDVDLHGVPTHTLFMTNDNDFIAGVTDTYHPAGAANPNQFFVFGFTDADLPGFVPQEIEAAHEDEDGHGHSRD